MARATTSTPEPAGKPMISVTGCWGQSAAVACAKAGPHHRAAGQEHSGHERGRRAAGLVGIGQGHVGASSK
jgi:hypothetical protein